MNIFATEQGILGATDYARQHNTFHAFLTLARSIRKRLGAWAHKLDVYIEHYRIQIAPLRHNGKVERQHRTDELRFYKHMWMYCLEDGRRQPVVYQRRSNDHIMTCLGMRSLNQVLELYQGIM